MKTIQIIKNIAFVVLFSLVLLSCEKKYETDDLSSITYYPTFEMEGGELYLFPMNTPFVDPGIKAIENGVEIPVSTVVRGTIQSYTGSVVNTDLANEYQVTYSATNSDGFSGSISRTIWVANTGNLTTSIEGLYTSTVGRNGAPTAQYTDMEYVLIYKTGATTYKVSDGIGGYYDLGRVYGPSYRAIAGNITANDISTNDFSYPGPFGVGAFGGTATMSGMTVDAGAKKVAFTTVWDAGPYTFVVTLTQVNI